MLARGLLRFFVYSWQVDLENGSLPNFAVDPDVPPTLVYYAVDARQPQLPVPLFCSFVVKKGSKIRACVSASMPMPVSVTASIKT